ncbi:hypothetical protein AA313_de0207697 [Arthrobotrys entomopaga]|nr:hypothetical protein AA313_de0207697 [Arthrobotrys entomopaga]
MSPVTPRKLKSCLSATSSPSDCSSPANSLASTPTATATPPTPYSTGGSSCYSTPTPAPRRQKKSVRFHPEAEIKEFRQVREIRETRSRSSGSTSTVTKRTEERQVIERKVEKAVVEKRVERKVEKKVERRVAEKKEEVLEVKKGKKRKESQDESYYYESTNGIMQTGGGTGLGITVDHSYGPPTKAPPQAPLPRPAKRERTKYSQSPQTKPVEPKMTYSFDDSTSTSSYPNMSFGQAPPPPIPTLNTSFTEIGNYPPVPQIMSTGFSFTEQAEPTWWAYQEPAQQPPTAAASSRPLRRKRSFEAKKVESRQPVAAPEIVDVDSMRSRRGSSKSTSSTSSSNSMDYSYNEPKVEIPTRTSSRRRREEENWEEQYRMESIKRQARQKTRDREIKKQSKHSRADPNSSFDHDAGAGYYNKGPAYSFSAADEGYDRYF